MFAKAASPTSNNTWRKLYKQCVVGVGEQLPLSQAITTNNNCSLIRIKTPEINSNAINNEPISLGIEFGNLEGTRSGVEERLAGVCDKCDLDILIEGVGKQQCDSRFLPLEDMVLPFILITVLAGDPGPSEFTLLIGER